MQTGDAQTLSAARIVWIGLLGLAAAMGIGRFAFTPLLPLMQAHDGLTLTQGGWLASANYLGYLLGALGCTAFAPQPERAARSGLVLVALFTLATAWVHGLLPLALLRFGAGVGSALVLVGLSSWALAALAARGRGAAAGWVFAGVGIGITVAGAVAWLAGAARWAPALAWGVLGALTLAVAVFALRTVRVPPRAPASHGANAAAAPFTRHDALVVACYAAFGFGYIVPATFLPAFARELVDDPRVFGLVWPVFGVAAAASTVWAARRTQAWPARTVWAASQAVMAFGVLLHALWPSLTTTVVSALCVGGTFVVATMAGLEHARRSAGARAPRLIAVMTAAFALGQLIGPLLIRAAPAGAAAGSRGTELGPALLATALLLASSAALMRLPAAR
ncbi:MAG: YbfB/YjiJ family MFS transporter [Ideonella sp.]|nr:YbfB/YjiJ family MFS transporter [Ideonella sp.]MCC7455448.1 YbfB/YjiJ family MFS transporter [Nitrospira sp.]